MGKYMRDASLSFAAARFAAGDNLPYESNIPLYNNNNFLL